VQHHTKEGGFSMSTQQTNGKNETIKRELKYILKLQSTYDMKNRAHIEKILEFWKSLSRKNKGNAFVFTADINDGSGRYRICMVNRNGRIIGYGSLFSLNKDAIYRLR